MAVSSGELQNMFQVKALIGATHSLGHMWCKRWTFLQWTPRIISCWNSRQREALEVASASVDLCGWFTTWDPRGHDSPAGPHCRDLARVKLLTCITFNWQENGMSRSKPCMWHVRLRPDDGEVQELYSRSSFSVSNNIPPIRI